MPKTGAWTQEEQCRHTPRRKRELITPNSQNGQEIQGERRLTPAKIEDTHQRQEHRYKNREDTSQGGRGSLPHEAAKLERKYKEKEEDQHQQTEKTHANYRSMDTRKIEKTHPKDKEGDYHTKQP